MLSAPPNVGVEQPALQHFLPPQLASRPASHGGAGPTPSGFFAPFGSTRLPVGLVLVVLFGSVAAVIVLGVFVRRAVPVRLRRLPEVAAVPFAITAVLAVLMLVPKTGGQAAPDGSASPSPSAAAAITTAQRIVIPTRPAGAAGPLWTRLISIEAEIINLESQLQAMKALGDTAANPSSQATATALENALQGEYQYYLTTVRDPSQQAELVSAARLQPAAVRDTVLYNVQAIETQLAQEAAIAAAQQSPSALGIAGSAPGTLSVPLSGVITQGFGPTSFALEPAITFDGVTYPHFHTGTDIAAPLDSPVHAAAAGVVLIAGQSLDSEGNLIGYGNYVVIAHAGKLITLYGHLDKLLVHAGQVVHSGDVIGLEGSTGYSTGPHLHFEVRLDGLLVNPIQYLGSTLKSA